MNENNFFYWVGKFLRDSWPQFLQGAGVTLAVAIIGTAIGCLIGLLVGVLRTIRLRPNASPILKILNKILQAVLIVYIEVFRGTPMIVQAMLVYYGFMQYLGVDLSCMTAALLVVSINTGAYMAETVRGGIDSVEIGQTEGAMAIGMTHWQTMTSVILPQTLRNILPQIGNNLIINIKDTSVLNVISVTELFFVTKSVAGTYMRYFEPFFIACALYLIMTIVCSRLLRVLERRMDGSRDYQLAGSLAMSKGCV